jgi:hypothetical protein
MIDRLILRRLAAGFGVAAAVAVVVISMARPSRGASDVAEPRKVSGFDHIRLRGAFTTEIIGGARTTHVVVTAPPDVLSRVTTDVSDGTLVVEMRSGTNIFSGTPKLRISLPVLRGFANEGAGNIKISGLTGADVAITNAGAATIDASGRAMSETISLNGTGKIDTTGVDARDVTVDNNGVGIVHVRASGSLTMNVNGVGEIRYTGNPAHVDSHVNGVGRISPL